MNKLLFLFILLLSFATKESTAQVVFGVSPGLHLNSAYIGYKFSDQFMASLGLQYYGVNYSFTEDGDELENFKGALIIPSLGLKYFMARKNQIQPYLSLVFSKPLISGSLVFDGEPDEDFEDAIDNVSLLGVGFGFGVEYFFDENFSLGGEYGIQFMSVKVTIPEDFELQQFEEEIKTSFNPTYTKLTLNYYFGGGE